MDDRLEQLIEMECADALLDGGVSVPLKRWRVPFKKRPLELRVTMKRPRLRGQMLLAREYLKLEKENADFMELEKLTLGSLRKAVQDGDTVNGTLMAGQIAGLIRREQTCREIIEETVQQAQECIAAQGQHKKI